MLPGARHKLLIIGGHPDYMNDLAGVRDIAKRHVMAVNEASTRYLYQIDYLTTYHPENILYGLQWLSRREKSGGNLDFMSVLPWYRPEFIPKGMEYLVIPYPKTSGTSSLFAVLAGIHLGYRDITIAGAPMDDEPYRMYRRGWIENQSLLVGNIRSMSGWTKEFLETNLNANRFNNCPDR